MLQIGQEFPMRREESCEDAPDAARSCLRPCVRKAFADAADLLRVCRGEHSANIGEELSRPRCPSSTIHLEIREEMKVATLQQPSVVSDGRDDTETAVTDHGFDAILQGCWHRGECRIPSCTVFVAGSNDRRRNDGRRARHRPEKEEIHSGFPSANPIPDRIRNQDNGLVCSQRVVPREMGRRKKLDEALRECGVCAIPIPAAETGIRT